jgi:3-oxoacyl-[acyl-carrier protein] reductase
MDVKQRFSLAGRKALVTGASRGIGIELCAVLSEAGADIVAVARDEAGLAAAAAKVEANGRKCLKLPADLGKREEPERVGRAALEAWGTIDILVNNAGVTRDGLFRKMDREAWDTVINTNLNSVFEITQNFIEPMAARGWGRVINISSIVGQIGNFGQANYAAAKAGLIGLTKTLAREYARKGVTVNAIAPGFVKTRMLDGVPDKALQSVLDITPVGRLGEPMEIGASVLYLASPSASFVTGHVLDVNGGMAM